MDLLTSLFVFLFYAFPTKPVSGGIRDTLSVDERVSFLKYVFKEELNKQINGDKKPHPEHQAAGAGPKIINDDYDYVDLSNIAITPINEKDERKEYGKFKLRQLKTTKTTTELDEEVFPPKDRNPFDFAQPTTPKVNPGNKKSQLLRNDEMFKPLYEPSTGHPLAEFYRLRRGLEGGMLDVPLQWTHCGDLITPYVTGLVKELTKPIIIGPTHRNVERLVHLIETNVTMYTKQDIYALMYQISNIQLRLYTWDNDAIRLLLSVLCQGQKHSFRALKYGLKMLFQEWHLDISDANNLLTQSRVFRPVCLKMQAGSTKTSRVTTYSTRNPSKLKGVEKCSDESEHD